MLERLWHKNQAILRSLVRNILVDPSSVDDVLQESFIKLLNSNKQFFNQNEAYNYMRKVVLNTTIDHYRCLRRRNAYSLNSGNPYPLSSSAPNPLNLLIEKEKDEVRNSILKEVRKTLGKLPPEQREAIDIAFNRNHRKIKDICTEKAIPYSTIRSRVTAAIDQIRRQLTVKGIYRTLGEVSEDVDAGSTLGGSAEV
ncbi:MAG: RNA polymerase sigma factor [Acidobacteria bacterium]|nr:RNA polymerase sigma factor [Acidobacteriota bacterium]